MEFKFKPKFEIGQRVYMNVAGGEEHIIVDINFCVAASLIKYQIMGFEGTSGWYTQVALTTEKIIL